MKDLVDNLGDLEGMETEWRTKEMTSEELLEMRIWTCYDGRKVKLQDMTCSHLEKAILAIEEGRVNRPEWLEILKTERQLRDKKCNVVESLNELKRRIENMILDIATDEIPEFTLRRSIANGNEILKQCDKLEKMIYGKNGEMRF